MEIVLMNDNAIIPMRASKDRVATGLDFPDFLDFVMI